MSHGNRPTFRARALDQTRPLEVYHKNDLITRQDFMPGDRAMPAMSSGMEAEEESEHHLQRAIATETLSSGKKFIPTPDAIEVDYYKEFYTDVKYMTRRWKQGYIVQDLALTDEKPPEYNMDTEDEEFRQTLTNPTVSEMDLENILDQLEDAEITKGQLAPFCREWNWGKGIIGEGVHHKKIHQFWVKKRSRINGPIKDRLLREKPIDTANVNESYICFRRRLDKIQTRRNKQRDQLSYTRMVKLRRDLMKLLNLCNLMKRREDKKSELIDQDFRIIKSRLSTGDFKNETLSKLEKEKANEQRRLNGVQVIIHFHFLGSIYPFSIGSCSTGATRI